MPYGFDVQHVVLTTVGLLPLDQYAIVANPEHVVLAACQSLQEAIRPVTNLAKLLLDSLLGLGVLFR